MKYHDDAWIALPSGKSRWHPATLWAPKRISQEIPTRSEVLADRDRRTQDVIEAVVAITVVRWIVRQEVVASDAVRVADIH